MSLTHEELKLFVKSKDNYYTLKWTNMKTKNTIFSWNWASFIFGPFWMIYRKLYLIGLLVIIIYSASYIVLSHFVLKKPVIDIVLFGYSIKNLLLPFVVLTLYIFISFLWGKIANYLYYRSIERKSRSIKETISEFAQQKSEFEKRGGTIIDVFRTSYTVSPVVSNTIFPLTITIATVLFTIGILDLQFIQNFEYQITDAAKFAIKDHKEHTTGNDLNSWIDSPISILGVTERSQFNYLNNILRSISMGSEERLTYADFLSYFRPYCIKG